MKSLLGFCIVALGAGCFGSVPQAHYYTLDRGEPEVTAHAAGTPYPFSLHVTRFATALAYDRYELVYRPHGHELRIYDYHLWVAKPERLISEAMARHLDRTGLFLAVSTRAETRPAEYELRGEIMSLDEVDVAPKDWRARLAMKLVLVRSDSEVVVWQHAFEAERVVSDRTPGGVVATLAAILQDELAAVVVALDSTFAHITGTSPHLTPGATAAP